MNRPTREEYEFDGCHDGKYKILNGITVGYVEHLENYCDSLEKALNKACEEWIREVYDCDFILLNACDGKCGYCDLNKRIEYKKEWAMKDE